MAGRVIWHIGQPKTGTTILQATLEASSPVLARAGVCYPALHGRENHRALAPWISDGMFSSQMLMRSLGGDRDKALERSRRQWALAAAAWQRSGSETLVLSAEVFFQPFRPPHLKRLKHALARLGGTVQPVAYLRSPLAFALSAAQQQVKLAPLYLRDRRGALRRVIERMDAALPHPVDLNLYDRGTLLGGDIVEDFVTRYLPGVEIGTLIRPAMRDNSSLSSEAMAVLHDIHTGALPNPLSDTQARGFGLSTYLGAVDAGLAGATRPALHPAMQEAFLAMAKPDLLWLQHRRGITFPDIDNRALARLPVAQGAPLVARVEDMCPVDQERKQALVVAIADRARLDAHLAERMDRRETLRKVQNALVDRLRGLGVR